MDKKEFKLQTHDGIPLKGAAWIPEAKPLAVLCMVHGLGDQYERHAHVAEQLCRHNIAVYIYDQRGHGRSGGQRGHTPLYEDLLRDLETVIKHLRSAYEHVPFFLYGHSMGGNVVAGYLLQKDTSAFAGAVLSSPWLKLSFAPPAWQVKLAKVMNNLLPSLTQPNGLNPKDISSDPTEQQKYASDPLVHKRVSVRMYVSMVEQGLAALQKAHRLKVPVLVMHGDADKITSAAASQEFAEKAGSLATYKPWPGLRHEPHNETPEAREVVISFLKDWLLAQVAIQVKHE
jgi:acylglycerol lipase